MTARMRGGPRFWVLSRAENRASLFQIFFLREAGLGRFGYEPNQTAYIMEPKEERLDVIYRSFRQEMHNARDQSHQFQFI